MHSDGNYVHIDWDHLLILVILRENSKFLPSKVKKKKKLSPN